MIRGSRAGIVGNAIMYGKGLYGEEREAVLQFTVVIINWQVGLQ
jgi:hypothetical protein